MEKKLGRTDMGTEGDDEPAGYGLRENPQKSWKFSGSDQEISGPENLCKICGKVFDSIRALLCHVRHHSDKRRKGIHCKECGEEFKSLRALSDHTECHPERFRVSNQSCSISSQKQFVESQYCGETSALVRKNTSTRLSNTISTNSSSANQTESSSYVAELDQEVIEAAVTLLMLSKGIRADRHSSVTEFFDNNSATFEVKSPNQCQRVVGQDGENSICDDDESLKTKKSRPERLKSTLSSVVNAFDEKKVFEFSENHSGFASDKEKVVKMEVSSGRFCRGVSHKMPNLDDESAFELGDTEMDKETVTYNEGKEYKCSVCFKVFASGQALGGHMRARSIKHS